MDLLKLLDGLDSYISVCSSGLRTLKEVCIGISEACSVNLQEGSSPGIG